MTIEPEVGVSKIDIQPPQPLAIADALQQSPRAIGAFKKFLKSAQVKKEADLDHQSSA
jgi:hypothetical protein